MTKLNIFGITGEVLAKIEKLMEDKPSGPMYQSQSHGLIPIASMNERHRFNAARRLIHEKIDELYNDIGQALNLSELQPFVSGLPFSKSELETLEYLTSIQSLPGEATTATTQTKPIMSLDSAYDTIIKRIQGGI